MPKEKFDDSCYLSMTYGRSTGDDESFYKTHLDLMQSGAIIQFGASALFPNEDQSENDIEKEMPQVRILAHKIQPEEGFHIVRNSTLSNVELKKIEDSVWVALQVALTGRRLPFEPKSVFKQEDQLGTTS